MHSIFPPLSPYGDKCNSIHDPCASNEKHRWWLTCKQYDDRDEGINSHIDCFRETKQAIIHHGESFGRRTPEIMSSYKTFRDTMCNVHSENGCDWKTSLQRLHIIKIMRDSQKPGIFSFSRPSHLVYGRVSMILQEKDFYVPFDISHSPSPAIEIHSMADFTRYQGKFGPGSIVTAREIAFGAPGSNTPEDDPAIWFNLPPESIRKVETASIKLATSRRRKISQQAESLHSILTHKGFIHWAPFYTYYSDNKNMRQLIDGVFDHRLHELNSLVANDAKVTLLDDSIAYHYGVLLKEKFEAIKNEHEKYGWPVIKGRNVDDFRAVPIPTKSRYTVGDGTTHKFAKDIYSSFSSTIQPSTKKCEKSRSPYSKIFSRLAQGESPKASNSSELKFEPLFNNSPSCLIFPSLTKDESIVTANLLPKICGFESEPLFTNTFENHWEQVKKEAYRMH